MRKTAAFILVLAAPAAVSAAAGCDTIFSVKPAALIQGDAGTGGTAGTGGAGSASAAASTSGAGGGSSVTSSSQTGAGGGSGCSSSADCPTGQACNTTSHTCSTSCDGVSVICKGGCCVNSTCAPGTSIGACGAGGLLCATSCLLGACSLEPTWGGGSCECGQDSHCNGVATGPRCVGPPGSGVCGCLGNADCGVHTCALVGIQGLNGGYCK